MQDVRHDPDPPPPSSTRENVKTIPPSTPSSSSPFNHPASAISLSSISNRRAYFSTPIAASSTSTPQRSGATPPIATYSSASSSSLLESPFSQEWPTYSSSYSSRSNTTRQHSQVMGRPSSSAASVSPPNIPYLQPVFMSSSNSNKYMDYYVPSQFFSFYPS